MLPRNSSPHAARSCCPGRVLLILAAFWLLAGCQVLIGISDVDGLQDPESDGDGGVPVVDAPRPNAMQRRIQLNFRNSTRDETLRNFPVLVKLNQSRMNYELTAPNGADVHFVDAGGQALAHQIERWDPAGESWIWVKVPVIEGDSDDSFIYLYYGDASAGVLQQPEAVWSDAFAGVYHLSDDLESGFEVRDSTDKRNHGTKQGSVQSKAAAIGMGMSFPGTGSSYINLGDVDAYEPGAGKPLTVEAWFYTAQDAQPVPDPPPVYTLLYKDYGCHGWKIFARAAVLAGYFSAATGECGSQNVAQSLLDPVERNRWYYVAATMHRMDPDWLYSCTTIYWDDNGAPTSERACEDRYAPGQPTENDGEALIGSGYAQADPFAGILDEVRISTTIRTSAWISAQFASMNDQFLVYGPDEVP